MRAALVLMTLSLAGPALAQQSYGSLQVQTINGVRVWRPKSTPAPLGPPPAAAQPSTTIVVNPAPIVLDPEPQAYYALPVGPPYLGSRPFISHRRPSPHGRPQIGLQKLRRF
jgi:hypothetical protein